MSSRQIRRLQQLVLAATEEDDLLSGTSPQSSPNAAAPRPAEGGDDENNEEDNEEARQSWPATMRRPERRSARHRPRAGHADRHPHSTSSSKEELVASPASPHSPAREEPGGKRQPHAASGGLLPAEVQDKAAKESSKKASKRRAQLNKRRQIAEEEALLEAALQESGRRLGDATTRASGGDGADAEGRDSRSGSEADYLATLDLVELLCVCDPTRLNTRQERIRAFGAAAVEDIGDGAGPLRRAEGRETGASSVFGWPASRFAFRTSLLATANRYHWPPYDSLGARLELLPVPQSNATTSPNSASTTHGAKDAAAAPPTPFSSSSFSPVASAAAMPRHTPPAATPRPDVYALNCDSITCHRAAATLAECLENANTVQELLQCLSACRVYYLPALLRCYMAFLLVNRVDYAYEMVDCALYHVGLVLGRFPWQGTWRQRLVPWVLGNNPLLHTTLQLGSVVAQRRGCPRTAWEFAKALLSFDPRDQERMLLRIDYAALSAKRWVWLLELYLGAMRVMEQYEAREKGKAERGEESTSDGGEAGRVRASWEPLCAALTAPRLPSTGAAAAASAAAQRAADNAWVARRVALLPGFAFAAALAKHCLELEEARAEPGGHRDPNAHEREGSKDSVPPSSPVMMAGGSSGSGGPHHLGKKPSRVLREMTPEQRRFLQEQVPSATTLMAGAMLRFPHAACALVQSLQGIESVCSRCNNTELDTHAWRALEAAAQQMTDHATLLSVKLKLQLDSAFVESQGELWKPLQMLQLIAAVVGRPQNDDGNNTRASPLARHADFARLGFSLDAERALSRATALTAASDDAAAGRDYETLSVLRFYGGDAATRTQLLMEAGNDLIVHTAASMQVAGKGSDVWHAVAPSVVATQTMIGIVVALEEMSRAGQHGNAAFIPDDDDEAAAAARGDGGGDEEPPAGLRFRFVENPLPAGDDVGFFFGTPPPSDADGEWEDLETLPPD